MKPWDRFWYGDSNPRPAKKSAVSIVLIMALTCWFGLRADFMLGEQWLKWGTIGAVAMGLVCSSRLDRILADTAGVEPMGRAPRMSVDLGTFIISCLISWILLVFAFPAWATKWLSAEAFTVAELRKDKSHSRHGCDYRVSGEYIQRQPAGYICISAEEFERLPASGSMLVREKRSIFGVYVEGVQPVIEESSEKTSKRS